MKILRLSIKNFMGIRAAEFSPDGHSIEVTGGNAIGKTSILNAVKALFSGIDESQIHVDTERAEVFAELEEVSIEQKLSACGRLATTVKTSDGVKLSKPATYLKEIANALAFNPVAFFFLPKAEKRAALLRAMPIRIDRNEMLHIADEIMGDTAVEFSVFVQTHPEASRVDYTDHGLLVLDRLFRIAYEARHAIGVELKEKRAILETAEASLPPAEFNADEFRALDAEIREADGLDLDIATLDGAIEAAAIEVEQVGEEIERLKKKQDAIAESMVKGVDRLDELKKRREALDVMAKRSKHAVMLDARAVSKAREDSLAKLSKVRDSEVSLAKKRATFQAFVEFFEKDFRSVVLASAKLPVENLTITETEILVGGVAVESLSGGEQMRFALSLAEGAIPTNGARVMCIDGAERLDPDQFAILRERFSRGDLQAFITRVTSGEMEVATL